MITNAQTGTNIQEIADGIYRINTPVALPGGPAFSFNQYLLVDDEPLLFHTGPRRMFPLVRDGEQIVLGRHTLQWFDTPHVPHGWDCGLLMDITSATFFCGDLFTQPGHGEQALTEGDIFGPSETSRQSMDYYAHTPQTLATLARLAEQKPRTLACMHGSAWRGDGATLLRALAKSLG